MIYDEVIELLQLPSGVGVPLDTSFSPVSSHYCGEMQVFQSRYWNAVQAGSRVDRMVEVGELISETDGTLWARFKGHVYSVEQIQYAHDENNLPCSWLSLKRAGSQFENIGGTT